ncbi:MAG: hypothetical protein V6Z89_13785 [Desulfobacter sp.]
MPFSRKKPLASEMLTEPDIAPAPQENKNGDSPAGTMVDLTIRMANIRTPIKKRSIKDPPYKTDTDEKERSGKARHHESGRYTAEHCREKSTLNITAKNIFFSGDKQHNRKE